MSRRPWPPAARYYEVRRPGTGQLPFRPKPKVEVVKACRFCCSFPATSLMGNKYACYFCFDGEPQPERVIIEKPMDVVYHSISASPAYSGKSFEELRLEDYDQARDDATGHVPYFPTREILTRKVEFSVDGDVEDVTVRLEVVYHAITAMPEYSGKSFEELRIEECYQQGRDWGNRLRRDCATCRRSLAIDKYSNTQLKKGVGVSRCKDCVVRVWPT